MKENALKHARQQRDTYLAQLLDFLRIPSISTKEEHRADVRKAAEWLAAEMRRVGLNNVQIYPTPGHPVVYGEWLGAGPAAPTVLVYGHYDVQPVDPVDLWHTPPFEPTIHDGHIFARGASDDKGQMFVHVKAFESIMASNGALPVNIKMMFEGEEEHGSVNLDDFVLGHKDLLAADSALISDGRILSHDQPSIVYGLRGLAYMEFKVRGPKRDLHSGSYGGTVHNPAQLVAEIITAMHGQDGRVLIPGFYDRVRALSAEERSALAKVPYGLAEWSEETGLSNPWGEPDFSLLERIGARPTCEVNGIYGGYIEPGSKTIIPAAAGAKVSMRLVADQDPDEIAALFARFVQGFIPADYQLEIIKHSTGWPAITPINSPEMQAAAAAYQAAWGKAPIFMREGGSIPVTATIQRELGAPVVLMGFGLDDNIHSPNENFRIESFHLGVETVIQYLYNLAP